MTLHRILFFLLLSAQAFSQKPALPEDVMKSVKSRVEYGLNTSIVIGIIDKNGPQYYSFGTKSKGGKPVDEHTIYEIGSVSKVFTATLLATNIVQGKMKAEDPISDYLPQSVKVPVYDGGGQPITLGHLSDHTSSLPRMATNMPFGDPGNPFADYTVELLYDFLSSYSLPREVGSEFEYSNLAVGLLGHILALKASSTYEAILGELITGPLEMKETGITLTEKMKANLATGYAMGEKTQNWDLNALQGAGAIRSSTHDMLAFLAANIGLKESALTAAMTLAQTPRHDKAGAHVGLGWFVDEGSEGNIIWHNGATGGYRAFAGFVKETGRGVVVLTNSDASVDDIGLRLLDPESPLQEVKPQYASYFKEIIDKDGAAGLVEKYNKMEGKNPGKYELNEDAINALGYDYLGVEQVDAALELFRINVLAFPESSNVYDSYGEALMKKGQQQEAIANYKKSLELDPTNMNAVEMLALMGVEYKVEEIKVDDALLQSYTGTYELAPGFNIAITREGSQLFVQATGQPRFEVFPKSDTEFYLKVVEARIVFSKTDNGENMMTLYQGGQVMPGKKIK